MAAVRFLKLDSVPFAYQDAVRETVEEVAGLVHPESHKCWAQDESRCEIRKGKCAFLQIAFCTDHKFGAYVGIIRVVRDVPPGFDPVVPRMTAKIVGKVYLPHPWSKYPNADPNFEIDFMGKLIIAYAKLP